MPVHTAIEAPRIFPAFRYRNAARTIEWLVEAFGFTVHVSYTDDGGVVQHAGWRSDPP